MSKKWYIDLLCEESIPVIVIAKKREFKIRGSEIDIKVSDRIVFCSGEHEFELNEGGLLWWSHTATPWGEWCDRLETKSPEGFCVRITVPLEYDIIVVEDGKCPGAHFSYDSPYKDKVWSLVPGEKWEWFFTWLCNRFS